MSRRDFRRAFRLPESAAGQSERDVDEELAFHLEMRVAKLCAEGWDEDHARAEAARRLGGLSDVKAACLAADRPESWRERLGVQWSGIAHDTRLAARSLRRTPGFSICAVLLLAVGIGGTLAAFSIVNAIAFRPLPYPHADRLALAEVALDDPRCGGRCTRGPTRAEAERWASTARSAEAFGTLQLRQGPAVTDNGRLVLEGAAVSRSLVDMLRPRAALGRMLDAGDFVPGAGAVLVLGHDFWRTEFGGDSTVLGRTMRLYDARTQLELPHRVVGVLAPASELGPPIFALNARTAHYLVPQRTEAGEADDSSVGLMLVRARPGIALAQLGDELDLRLRQSEAESAPSASPTWRAHVTPLRTALAARYEGSFWLLLAAVGVVLALTCVNVGGLVVARLDDRVPELATRTALGATRFQLARQVVLETALLAVLGGAGGVLLAQQALRLVRLIPAAHLPFWTTVTLDTRVAAMALLITLGSVLLLSLAPLALLRRRRVLLQLRALVAGNPARTRRRGTVVALQVACSVVLLTSAGLFLKLLVGAERRDLGYARQSVLYVSLDLPRTEIPDGARGAWAEDALVRVRSLPGVLDVGLTGAATRPASGRDAGGGAASESEAAAMRRRSAGGSRAAMTIEGREEPLPRGIAPSSADAISPTFFSAIGTPVLRGRAFTAADHAGAPPVAILDAPTEARLFPGASAIGRRVRLGDATSDRPWLTIVGVVAGTVASPLDVEDRYTPQLYVPHAQTGFEPYSLVVRTAGDARALKAMVRRAVQSSGGELTVASVITIEEGLAKRLWPVRFNAAVLGAFALFATVLACLGVYALVRYAVGRRRREIAVRMALGATQRGVVVLMVRAGLMPVGVGLVIGLLASAAATRILHALLYGATPFDPTVFGGVAAALLAVSATAAYAPARRAAAEDPARALRAE